MDRNHWNINYALNEYYDKELGSFTNTNLPKAVKYPDELIELFEKYSTETKSGKAIGIEGMILYFTDLEVSLEDLVTICLAKLLSWRRLTDTISREQFLNNWFYQGCSNLTDMRAVLKDLDSKLHSDLDYFSEIYSYTFKLILDDNRNTLDSETAIEYWKLYFTDNIPIKLDSEMLQLWFKFLDESQCKEINKDCWQMLLILFKKFPSLMILGKEYNEADAWPYIIDEFYEYLEDKCYF